MSIAAILLLPAQMHLVISTSVNAGIYIGFELY